MATSDNVVRAGLTPKFKDVDVLVSYAYLSLWLCGIAKNDTRQIR